MIKLTIAVQYNYIGEHKMCNQFKLPSLLNIKHYLVNDLNLPLAKTDTALPENQDVFPKQIAPVLLYQNNKLQLSPKSWGYPSPVDNKKVLFNARVERFYQQKPSMWDKSFARQRCLIIADKFFEYGKKTYQAANNRKYHERYSFQDPDNPLTLIAGIYDEQHFAMVTTEPNSVMALVHNRMPLVVRPEELRQWLFQNFTKLVDRSNVPLSAKKIPNKN